MKPFQVATLILLVVNGMALGDPDVAPVPRLGTAPSTSAWTIAYQYQTPNPYLKPPDPSQAAVYEKLRNLYPRLVSINVIKSADRRKEVLQLDNQTESIRWIEGKLLGWQNLKLNTFVISDATSPGVTPFNHDFDSLSWIDQADYKGHQSYQGVDCCVYHSTATPQGEQTAYIEAKSGLPVGVQQNGVTLHYVFMPSNESVQFPPDVEARFKEYLTVNPNPNR